MKTLQFNLIKGLGDPQKKASPNTTHTDKPAAQTPSPITTNPPQKFTTKWVRRKGKQNTRNNAPQESTKGTKEKTKKRQKKTKQNQQNGKGQNKTNNTSGQDTIKKANQEKR